ncbi:MAG: DUF3794 domain-containing protein [Clostridium perfringens]|nr:DUF3794 domain-containing protein [Clostridium perfringens]
MVNLDIIKENIQLEKLVGEESVSIPVKEEYLIPDTHPDVYKILSLDVDASITNREVQTDKVMVETLLKFNVIYLAKEDGEFVITNHVYEKKMSNPIDVQGAEHKMVCYAKCELEHINSNIINERKISVESYFTIKCKVYEKDNVEFIKDINSNGDVQVQKKPDRIEKIVANKNFNIDSKTKIKTGIDKPQIDKIISYNYLIHKKDIKILEDKVQSSCYMKINVIYKSNDSKELYILEDDIPITKEEEIIGVGLGMVADYDMELNSINIDVLEDETGEKKVVDFDVLINVDAKFIKIEDIEILDDIYSPTSTITVNKDAFNIYMTRAEGSTEIIVKDNITLENDDNIAQIINSIGKVISVNSKIDNNKVIVDGVLKVDSIYACSDENKYLNTITGDLPFEAAIDIQNITEGMECNIYVNLENIQSTIEANTIAVKAVIYIGAKVKEKVIKEYIKDIEQKDEIKEKTASIIIYVVQKNDSIWKLAKKYNTTMEDIIKLNNIENPDVIYEGEKLIIPGRAII